MSKPHILSASFSAIAAFAVMSASAQTVINPGFDPPEEVISDNDANGYGPISDWTRSGANVGVNSKTQPFLNQDAHSPTHVAFIQNGGNITQSISGFDPTKLYTVTYFVSERGLSGAATSTSVSLDGGTTSYTQAGNILKTGKFRRIVSSPLAVSGSTSTLQIAATGVSGDNALLIDTVSISRAVPAVPDNGFENPVQPGTGESGYKLGDGQGGGTLAGSFWTFGGKGGIARNGSSYSGSGQPQAAEGSQAAMLLTNNSSFSTVLSGFEVGMTYSLGFAAAGRAGTGAGGGLGPNTIEVSLGGTPLLFSGNATVTPAVSASNYTTYTTDEFTTSGGSLELKFSGLTPGDKTSFIDDIRFNFIAEGDAPARELKITSITKSGSTVTVQFEGIDGETYDLNKSTTMDFTIPDIQGSTTLSGTSGTLEDTVATEEKAFYRVEQQP